MPQHMQAAAQKEKVCKNNTHPDAMPFSQRKSIIVPLCPQTHASGRPGEARR